MRILKVAMAFAALLFVSVSGASAKVSINVDMTSQTMHVQSDGGETYDWPVSTAGQGYSTPRGTYNIRNMEVMHHSRKYHNSPMPHSMFFTGGFAIHGTYSERNLGRAASHGCVRLSRANAATLFALVRSEGGGRITLTGAPETHNQLAVDGHHKKRVMTASARHHKHHVTMMASNHHHQHHVTMAAANHGAHAPLAYAPAPHKKSLLEWLAHPVAQ